MTITIEKDDKAIVRLRDNIGKASDNLAKRVGKRIFLNLKEVTGKQYYSLKELRRLGHPYSTRFPKNYLLDDRIINLQTGALNRSLRWSYKKGKNKTIYLWANDPKALKLIKGDIRNRPRDFFNLALERSKKDLRKDEEEFFREVEYGITKN